MKGKCKKIERWHWNTWCRKIKSLDVLFSILIVSSASCSKCLAKQIDRCADGFMQMYVQYIYYVDSR